MKTDSSGLRLRGKLHCGARSGGSTNVEVADLLNRLPNAGLEHPLDSVHRRSLVQFHFYAAPRCLPFVLDGQRQAVAEPLHVLEHPLTRLHDHGADLDQQLRRPYMRDRSSGCSGNVSEFHQGCSFARFWGSPRDQRLSQQTPRPERWKAAARNCAEATRIRLAPPHTGARWFMETGAGGLAVLHRRLTKAQPADWSSQVMSRCRRSLWRLSITGGG